MIYIWLLYELNVLTMVMTWWCQIMRSLWRHKCAKMRYFQNHQIFFNYQRNFRFLLQFFFVWLIYYTFCCAVSLIYWFWNWLFMKYLFWEIYILRNIYFLGNTFLRSFGKILLFKLISKLLIFVRSRFRISNQCL